MFFFLSIYIFSTVCLFYYIFSISLSLSNTHTHTQYLPASISPSLSHSPINPSIYPSIYLSIVGSGSEWVHKEVFSIQHGGRCTHTTPLTHTHTHTSTLIITHSDTHKHTHNVLFSLTKLPYSKPSFYHPPLFSDPCW